jgi:cysteine desulfurase / selenocysteine lyase
MNDTTVSPLQRARLEFPGVNDSIYLETSARGLLPGAARDAALAYYDARVHGIAKETGAVFDAVEAVRARFAALIGVEADEVTLTRNVSEGLNMVVASLPWRTGDNAIVCREIEHPNGVYALYNMRDRHGIEVRVAEASADLAMSVEDIERRIDGRTRLVIVSSVTFATGARTELKRLGSLCRARGVLLLVDGAQSVGAIDLSVTDAFVDALAVGASKYLCGPYGLGFLYVRREVAESLSPAYLGRYSVHVEGAHEGEQGGEQYELMPAARRFDLGSYNYSAANAAHASLGILSDVGVAAIERHVLELSRVLHAGLRELGVPLVSGAVEAHRSHLVLAGARTPGPDLRKLIGDLASRYAAEGIRVSERHGRIRYSFHLYNTRSEVDAVIDATRRWPGLAACSKLSA